MKIAAIGDVHGRAIWKEVAEHAAKHADLIIFLGDYIDPYPEEIIEETEIKENLIYIKTYEKFNYDIFDDEEEFNYKKKNKKKTKKFNLNSDDIEERDFTPMKELDPEFDDEDINLSDEEYYKKYYGVPSDNNFDEDDNLSDEEFYKKYNKYFKDSPKYNYQPYEETVGILNDIIDFKKKNSDKVILLLGNHDSHYMYDEIAGCSRYDKKNCNKFSSIYKENKDLFQYAYQTGNHLFTHAGVCNAWVDFFDATLESYGLKKDYSNMADVLNEMGENRLSNKIINATGVSRGGNALAGGPTWADYKDTKTDYLKGMNQYVGHSMVNYIHTLSYDFLPGSITYCDVLENPKQNMASNYKLINI